MKWTEILTALVALYGAVLATFTFVTQWRSTRPKLKVQIAERFIIGFPKPGDSTDLSITVTAMNAGQKKVTLYTLSFVFPNNKIGFQVPIPYGPVRLPYELEPESSCTMWMDSKGMAKELHARKIAGKVKMVVSLTDAVGRQYKSKPFEFDSDRWTAAEPEA